MNAANPITPQASHNDPNPEGRAVEPSMEEILASIRRIIADDQSLPTRDIHHEPSPPDLAREASLHLLRPAPEPTLADMPHREPSAVAHDALHPMPPADDHPGEPMRAYGEVSAPQFASPAGPVESFERAAFELRRAAPETVELEPMKLEPADREPAEPEHFTDPMTSAAAIEEGEMPGHEIYEADLPEIEAALLGTTDDDQAAWHREASEPTVATMLETSAEEPVARHGTQDHHEGHAAPDRRFHPAGDHSVAGYRDPAAVEHFASREAETSTFEPQPISPAATHADRTEPSTTPHTSVRQGDGDVPSLFSAETDHTVASAFNMLAATRLADNSEELLTIARDMIRPLLRNWIDENLPSMVERMVRAEIERVARGGR